MATPRTTAPDSGFVLVGVVVFVLALTILVLSLYGLSSYEAQFLQRSLDEEQAFQSAVGGIERAKFVLTRTSQLPSVKNDLPLENVTAAVAIQDRGSVSDSLGLLDWLGADVTIRVTADVNGAQRTVEGRFSPVVPESYYSSLVTVRDGVEVETVSPLAPVDRDRTVLLDGPVWVGPSQDPNEWLKLLSPPDSIRTSPAAPVPDVAPFLNSPGPIDGATPTTATGRPGDPVILNASATPGVPRYFTSNNDPYYNFSFNSFPYSSPQSSCTIQVSGLAVWLLPRGAMFYQGTEITGDLNTDCLVVIAGPMAGTFGPSGAPGVTSSICSLGYLRASIPVILVSSGEVLLWHENDPTESSLTNDVAIFARSARLMGPYSTTATPTVLQLHRDPNGRLNTPLGLNPSFLEALASQGALPNVSSVAGHRLDLIQGTWYAYPR